MPHQSACFSYGNRSADGDINRAEYVQHKIEADSETERWEARTTGAQRQLAELLMKMEIVTSLGRLLDSSAED